MTTDNTATSAQTDSLRVAVVGSGPAGIYASDLLVKSDLAKNGTEVRVDLFERMPAPFGLIRYGVAPDHPRIKGIIKSLHNVMDKPETVSYTHLTLPTILRSCRSRWSPYH